MSSSALLVPKQGDLQLQTPDDHEFLAFADPASEPPEWPSYFCSQPPGFSNYQATSSAYSSDPALAFNYASQPRMANLQPFVDPYQNPYASSDFEPRSYPRLNQLSDVYFPVAYHTSAEKEPAFFFPDELCPETSMQTEAACHGLPTTHDSHAIDFGVYPTPTSQCSYSKDGNEYSIKREFSQTPRSERYNSEPVHDEVGVEKEEPYAKLIYRALLETPGHTMVLRDIYDWFKHNTDKAADKETKGWQNSIRHNLSMNGAFKKVEQPPGEDQKKGNMWRLTESAIREGVKSTTRYRTKPQNKRASKGAHGHHHPAPQRQASGAKGGHAARRSARQRRSEHMEPECHFEHGPGHMSSHVADADADPCAAYMLDSIPEEPEPVYLFQGGGTFMKAPRNCNYLQPPQPQPPTSAIYSPPQTVQLNEYDQSFPHDPAQDCAWNQYTVRHEPLFAGAGINSPLGSPSSDDEPKTPTAPGGFDVDPDGGLAHNLFYEAGSGGM